MSRMTRVGFVIGQLHVGGYERQLFELASRLVGGRCEPWVYCLSQVAEPYGPMLAAVGIPVRILPRRRSYELGRVLRLARLLRQDRIDVVHSWSLGTNFYAFLAVRLAGGRPLVTSNWSNDPTSGRVKALLDRAAFRRSRRIVVNSEIGRSFTARFYLLPPERIMVVRNWLDTSRFDSTADPVATRTLLGLPAGAPVAGFIGRMSWEKGISLFLDMARDVAARVPEARFLVVGDGPLLAEMRGKARTLGIGPQVLFTGFRPDVPDLLAALDLLVLTSSQEGLPNAVLEAMAAGRPVVATDVGGCRELIVDGVTGHLIRPGDRQALAESVTRILSAPDRGRGLGEAGRRRARSDFSVAGLVGPFEEAYCRIHREASGGTSA